MRRTLQLIDEVEQEFVEFVGDSEYGSVQMLGIDGGNVNWKKPSTTQTGQKYEIKLPSNVLQYFDLSPIGENGKMRCKCKKCGQIYLLASKYGTSNLEKHMEKCPRIDKDI